MYTRGCTHIHSSPITHIALTLWAKWKWSLFCNRPIGAAEESGKIKWTSMETNKSHLSQWHCQLQHTFPAWSSSRPSCPTHQVYSFPAEKALHTPVQRWLPWQHHREGVYPMSICSLFWHGCSLQNGSSNRPSTCLSLHLLYQCFWWTAAFLKGRLQR